MALGAELPEALTQILADADLDELGLQGASDVQVLLKVESARER
jgi:hypothetical protein